MKQSGSDADVQKAGNPLSHLATVFKRSKFIIAFLLNQTGSFMYYKLLGEYPLALSVSTANSLAFVFTALTEALVINKRLPDKFVSFGSCLIVAGIYLCHSSDLSYNYFSLLSSDEPPA